MLFSHMHNILHFIDIGFQLSNGNSSWFGISSLLQQLGTTFQAGVSNRWTGFSTGTWDWNVGLDYSTGTWDWNMGLDYSTGLYSLTEMLVEQYWPCWRHRNENYSTAST